MLTRVIAALSVVMIVLACAMWPQIQYYRLTGRFSPIKQIASLQAPVAVRDWTTEGLLLKDGRKLPVPGLRSLPRESDALAEISVRGIEIGTNGRIYGLVKVHHWCGNDPVRDHIAKVDVSEMLLFLRVGEPLEPIAGSELETYAVGTAGGRFSQHGWDVSEYAQFRGWLGIRDVADDSAADR